MTHLPYIVASYAIFAVLAVGFAVDAALRMARARRKLAAVDPRGMRER